MRHPSRLICHGGKLYLFSAGGECSIRLLGSINIFHLHIFQLPNHWCYPDVALHFSSQQLVRGFNTATGSQGRKTTAILDKCSAVAEIGDHNRYGGGVVPPFWEGSWVLILHNVAWAEAYLHTKWHPNPPSRLTTTDMDQNWGRGTVPPSLAAAGPHLTQCRLGRDLPPYQVAS